MTLKKLFDIASLQSRLFGVSVRFATVCILSALIFYNAAAQHDDGSSEDSNFTIEDGEELPRSDTSIDLHSEIKAVLSGDDFAQKKTVTRRRFIELPDEKENDEEEDEEQLEDSKHSDWLISAFRLWDKISDLFSGFPLLFEIILWGGLAACIAFFLLKYREQIGSWASDIKNDEPEPELPTSLFGLNIQRDSVSDDVIAEARSYWQSGDLRLAIAALLRSSLITLLHEHECRFFSSDTEAECCDRIDEQVSSELSVFMRLLVSVWQKIAYAHIDPSEAQFEQLCERWQELFK